VEVTGYGLGHGRFESFYCAKKNQPFQRVPEIKRALEDNEFVGPVMVLEVGLAHYPQCPASCHSRVSIVPAIRFRRFASLRRKSKRRITFARGSLAVLALSDSPIRY
jgi:hypothetical protein